MKPVLHIENRSCYDDLEVEMLVRFGFESVHRVWPIDLNRSVLKVKVTNTVRGWGGWGFERACACDREGFHVCARVGKPGYFVPPKRISYDRKWRDMPEMWLGSYRECIVYIAAHEFGHTAGRNGRKDGEIGTEFAGHDAVEEYRKVKAEIDARIAERISTRDTRITATAQRRASRRSFTQSAAGRLQKAERMLAYWERRAKLASTKIKRYRRSTNALRKSVAKENAANTPAPCTP